MNAQENYDRLIRLGFTPPFTLDLGVGKATLPSGVVGIGLNERADPGAHIFHNLEQGIPLPDECVIHLRSNQLLEHIHDIVQLFNEMWRVLRPGGTMWHSVPHYLSAYAWGDPTHVRCFSNLSFQYFAVDAETGRPFVETFSDYNIQCAFHIEKQVEIQGSELQVWMKKP